jgi:hypothetical protein
MADMGWAFDSGRRYGTERNFKPFGEEKNSTAKKRTLGLQSGLKCGCIEAQTCQHGDNSFWEDKHISELRVRSAENRRTCSRVFFHGIDAVA